MMFDDMRDGIFVIKKICSSFLGDLFFRKVVLSFLFFGF